MFLFGKILLTRFRTLPDDFDCAKFIFIYFFTNSPLNLAYNYCTLYARFSGDFVKK